MVPDVVEEFAVWRRTFAAFAVANAETRRLVRIYMKLCERVNECRGCGLSKIQGLETEPVLIFVSMDGWRGEQVCPQLPGLKLEAAHYS